MITMKKLITVIIIIAIIVLITGCLGKSDIRILSTTTDRGWTINNGVVDAISYELYNYGQVDGTVVVIIKVDGAIMSRESTFVPAGRSITKKTTIDTTINSKQFYVIIESQY